MFLPFLVCAPVRAEALGESTRRFILRWQGPPEDVRREASKGRPSVGLPGTFPPPTSGTKGPGDLGIPVRVRHGLGADPYDMYDRKRGGQGKRRSRPAPPRGEEVSTGYSASAVMCGYLKSVGGRKFSLMARGEVQRMRFHREPALSFVPEARLPPNGCWPTTAPVGLSLM